jgi:hypothetical protein
MAANTSENFAKKQKGEEGLEVSSKLEEVMARVVQDAVNQTDEKWQKRMDERDSIWEARAKSLLHECGNATDEKIQKAIEKSEKKQEEAMDKLREEMMCQLKGQINEVKSAVGAPGVVSANSQPNKASKIDHRIGSESNRKTFRERDPGVLQFTGKEAVDKKQAASVIESTLLDLGITKGEYTFSGPPRGQRFSVKFKEGAAKCTQPEEAAKFVRGHFAPKGEEEWKSVKFNREPDGMAIEYSFQYDVASNQQIKEIVTKRMFNMIKEKGGGDDFKMYKRDGTVFKGFRCAARVIVGYREDSFQVKWIDPKIFKELGIEITEIELALRQEFAKWCL